MPASMKKLLLNPEIIAIDQDPLGKPGGRRTKLPGSIEVWTRELRGGDLAVAVYFDAPGKFALEAVRVGWTAPLVAVRDVVNRTSLGVFAATPRSAWSRRPRTPCGASGSRGSDEGSATGV